MDSYDALLTLCLIILKLEENSMHWQALLIMIPEENLEHAFEIAIWTLRCPVLPDQPDLDIDILIDNALVSLKQ